MPVLYVVFFLTLLLSYLLPAKTDEQWRKKLFWTFVPLFIFGALRVDFGNDYGDYENFFNELHTKVFVYDETHHAEIGYQFLCYLMPSYRSLLVLNAFVLCLSLGVFCYENIPREYISLAILLIFLNVEKNIYGSLVGPRNGFAVATFILSTVFIQKRYLIAFAASTALAMTLHNSAIFFMPIAYIVGRNKELTKTELILWIGVIIAILVSSTKGLMDIVEPYVLDYNDSYAIYIKEEYHRGPLLTITGLILIIITLILFWGNKTSFSQNQNSLIRLGILYMTSTILGSVVFRAGYFYNMFFIGTIAIFMSQKRKTVLHIALCVLSIVMSIYSFYLWRINCMGNSNYDVYHSILDNLF